MLCSVYGICKVMEREIKFKDIIRTYSELPQASPNVSTMYIKKELVVNFKRSM